MTTLPLRTARALPSDPQPVALLPARAGVRNWFDQLPTELRGSLPIVDALQKTHSVLSRYESAKVRIAYSGGADSDVMMHMVRFLGFDVVSVFHDTGLEYDATWRQIETMRAAGYHIEVTKAKKPIPTSQRTYGYAFISKKVSNNLERLQKHGFAFGAHGNLDFDTLWDEYPNCKSALRWWTNNHKGKRNNISWNRWLKEFLIEYGLPFKVSDKCCDGAKKSPMKDYAKAHGIELVLIGVRRAEGGTRASAYHNCFVPARKYTYDMYFPLFWLKDSDRELYESAFGIVHSDAYTVMGLKRTGCAGCPFGVHFERELDAAKKYEPRLYKGLPVIFGPAYEWTRKYRAYAEMRSRAEREPVALEELPLFKYALERAAKVCHV